MGQPLDKRVIRIFDEARSEQVQWGLDPHPHPLSDAVGQHRQRRGDDAAGPASRNPYIAYQHEDVHVWNTGK